MVLGALLFLAPWVLGFVGVTALAWSCWIVGVLTVVLGASMFLEVMAVSVQERRRESHPVGDQATHAA